MTSWNEQLSRHRDLCLWDGLCPARHSRIPGSCFQDWDWKFPAFLDPFGMTGIFCSKCNHMWVWLLDNGISAFNGSSLALHCTTHTQQTHTEVPWCLWWGLKRTRGEESGVELAPAFLWKAELPWGSDGEFPVSILRRWATAAAFSMCEQRYEHCQPKRKVESEWEKEKEGAIWSYGNKGWVKENAMTE